MWTRTPPEPHAASASSVLRSLHMDRIPGLRLWIGGMPALRARQDLERAGITHIVSVLRPPPETVPHAECSHLAVEVDDVDDENLIEQFPRTNKFISDALAHGGAVLVHCAMGMSRSATIVAAYLMSSCGVSPDDALATIAGARPLVQPNLGFRAQLEIYHQMGCPSSASLDDCPVYQRWLYQQALEQALNSNLAPAHIHFRDAEAEIAPAVGVKADSGTPDKASEIALKCKKCRRTLATSEFITPHLPKDAELPVRAPNQPCSHHFVEPLLWMKGELEQGKLDGKLDCPKCQSKVGHYAWQGIKCNCGQWIVPGISLARAKVDEARARPQK